MGTLLYGIDARDPAVVSAAAGALLVSATLAAIVPARRAASIEPTRALRGD